MQESDWRSKIMTPLDETGEAREDFKEIIFEHTAFDKDGNETILRKIYSPKMEEWEIVREEQQQDSGEFWTRKVAKRIPIDQEIFDISLLGKDPDRVFTKIELKERNVTRIMQYKEGENGRELNLRVEPRDGFIQSLSTTYGNQGDESTRVMQLKFRGVDDVVVDLLLHPQARVPQTQFYITHESDGTPIRNGAAKLDLPFWLDQNMLGKVSYTDNGHVDTRIQRVNPKGVVLLDSQIQIPFLVDLDLYRSVSAAEDSEEFGIFGKWKEVVSLPHLVPVTVKTKGRA